MSRKAWRAQAIIAPPANASYIISAEIFQRRPHTCVFGTSLRELSPKNTSYQHRKQ